MISIRTLKKHLIGMGWKYDGRKDGGWSSTWWTFKHPHHPKLRLSWDESDPASGWCIEPDWEAVDWDNPESIQQEVRTGVAIGVTQKDLSQWMKYHHETGEVQWSSL